MRYEAQLLLFIQSPNTDLYVNILTHCVNHEGVSDIYFAVNEGDDTALSMAKEQIEKIRNRFDELIAQTGQDSSGFQQAYIKALDKVPTLYQVEKRIIKVLFAKPELAIKTIKKIFPVADRLLVDISGCSKKVSTDVIASFMSEGIKRIRHFELDKKVYTQKISRIYHNICNQGLHYYEYIDFSRPGTTINSFNRMRFQGNLLKILLIAALVLGISVVVLIQQNQIPLATLTSILFSALTAIGLILGLLNDGFNFFDRLEQS